jgi:hypothetical protein
MTTNERRVLNNNGTINAVGAMEAIVSAIVVL